jgi:hypothetical protein
MSAADSPKCPLTHTDDKVDLKVDPMPSDQLAPSYQASSEAPPPTPANAELDQSRCSRCRRRRFGHLFIALFFLWLTARYIVRHYQLRRFVHPYTDNFSWVGSLAELN